MTQTMPVRTSSRRALPHTLFLKAAISALRDGELVRINDTPAFDLWPECSKVLLYEELTRRQSDRMKD